MVVLIQLSKILNFRSENVKKNCERSQQIIWSYGWKFWNSWKNLKRTMKDHEEKIKVLEDKVATLEQSKETPSKEEPGTLSKELKCRECGSLFNKKSDMKVNILSLHPKQYECNHCSKYMRLEFELHQKVHTTEKQFICNVCKTTWNDNF